MAWGRDKGVYESVRHAVVSMTIWLLVNRLFPRKNCKIHSYPWHKFAASNYVRSKKPAKIIKICLYFTSSTVETSLRSRPIQNSNRRSLLSVTYLWTTITNKRYLLFTIINLRHVCMYERQWLINDTYYLQLKYSILLRIFFVRNYLL